MSQGEEDANELLELSGQVSVVSNDQLQREVIAAINTGLNEHQGGASGENEENADDAQPPQSDRIGDLLDIPEAIRLGLKNPFEMEKSDDDSGSTSWESTDVENDDDEYLPSDVEPSSVKKKPVKLAKRKSSSSFKGDSEDEENEPRKSAKKVKPTKSDQELKPFVDDGNDSDFERRMEKVTSDMQAHTSKDAFVDEGEGCRSLKHGLNLNISVWNRLYKYQKTGIRWLAELDHQSVGGILADEMGLGKTVQIIALLRTLDESQKPNESLGLTGLGPCLIVCPATLMQQWVREVHKWMPNCRIAVLHSAGSFKGSKSKLIAKMAVNRRGGSILVTSYTTFTVEKKNLVKKDWHYVILDEGHKIRNPDAQATLALKDVRTPHRIILSGSPMQNNLKELWSLLDFVYPGRLGSLKTFTEKFCIPITQGGYANATKIQATTAYKCAIVLRDAINPFILRRLKKDVQQVLELPEKNEQVLFCEITSEQRRLYQEYLNSRECARILSGNIEPFVGLIALRKLCNHPDLVTGGPNLHGNYDVIENPQMDFGWPERSGKMIVVKHLLKLWHKGGHKVLLFSQSMQMLNIMEKMIIFENYSYLRMDGSTAIGKRQQLVQTFNQDEGIFLFLLTTRVGGLGVNLTGANKVIIFDPDWNPSTDAQARERSWRIGQNRAVTIYRLLSTGTIEEKIYHRQIFKQFLANRVLKDPKQRQFFKTNDLHELFTLVDAKHVGTETGAIFAGETKEINKDNYFDAHEKQREKSRKERKKKKETKAKKSKSKEKIQEKPEEMSRIVELEDGEIASEPQSMEDGELRSERVDRSGPEPRDELPEHKHADHQSEQAAENDVLEIEQLDRLESSNGDDILDEESTMDVPEITEERRQQLREMARKLAARLAEGNQKGEEKPKKSKRKKENLLDGEWEIPYLRKQKEAKKNDEEEEKGREKVNKKATDDYVLGRLLETTGVVRSVMRHDDLIGEKPAYDLIEKEAENVAKAAAESIRRRPKRPNFFETFRAGYGQSTSSVSSSGMQNLNDGKNEEEKNGKKRKRSTDEEEDEQMFNGKKEKTDFLTAIRKRKLKHLESTTSAENPNQEEEPGPSNISQPFASVPKKFEKLAKEIQDFMGKRGGQAHTDQIVEAFKTKIAATDQPHFRAILKQICTFEKARKKWILKPTF
ncbi:hypothetical protein WR25_14338 [Diploscapter pachys]|uniref:DNA repair and recombination protein RAD54-like n=1 Tax=Diploscapter pachys TaxID=2018661 RepID=A0A2A2KHD7_9BILA|nr:hypothetical protein WR25_14338 [Diploscapter pachys]